MKERIIFLVGPTAVGKSRIALDLAKKIRAEIISCDSMQIYQGMKILASQPTDEFLRKLPHHLVGYVSPRRQYNAARYRKDALKKIREITRRKKIPLLVGGTGLYASVLLDGIFQAKSEDKEIRDKLYREARERGSGYLYRRLKDVDPEAAKKIHPHDTRRLVRALEVFAVTRQPISRLQKQRSGLGREYDVRIFCLNMPRDKLYQRIDQRVEGMFRRGLLREAKKLLRQRLSRTAGYAIGLRELRGYFAGEYDLAEAKRRIKRNSRLYAKRQLTWFRKDKRVEWINIGNRQKPCLIAQRIWRKLS
jgi:tRNA dimethylallyltransferase